MEVNWIHSTDYLELPVLAYGRQVHSYFISKASVSSAAIYQVCLPVTEPLPREILASCLKPGRARANQRKGFTIGPTLGPVLRLKNWPFTSKPMNGFSNRTTYSRLDKLIFCSLSREQKKTKLAFLNFLGKFLVSSLGLKKVG